MRPSQVQSVSTALRLYIDYLKLQRLSFSNLYTQEFNETCKADINEDDVLVHVADNTPILDFYQLRTEHFAAEIFRAEVALQQWLELAAAELVKI